jgi:hypothetical protein
MSLVHPNNRTPFSSPTGCLGTMQDKDFLAEADKSQLEVNPVSGEDVDKLVKDIYATPADIVAKAKEAAK